MNEYSVTLKIPGGRSHRLLVKDDQYILAAALRAGIRLPYSCQRGWCLSCAARVEKGSVDQSHSFRYYRADREAGFALLCTGRPRSDLIIRTHAREEMRKNRDRSGLPYPKGDWGNTT